jgi:hypothetical protein
MAKAGADGAAQDGRRIDRILPPSTVGEAGIESAVFVPQLERGVR